MWPGMCPPICSGMILWPQYGQMTFAFSAIKLFDPDTYPCIGENVRLMWQMVRHPKPGAILKEIKNLMIPSMRANRAIRLLTFCKSGKHRSVALARMLYWIFDLLGVSVGQPVHLAKSSWPQGICPGTCDDCVDGGHKDSLKAEVWRMWHTCG